MEQLNILLKYYDQEIRVTLPTGYNEFINSLCLMLVINNEKIKDFQISYCNNLDKKTYLINNDNDYSLLLNTIKQKNTFVINIELKLDNQNQNIIINNNNNMNKIINKNKKEENKKNDIENDLEPIELSFSDDESNKKDNINFNKYHNNNNIINDMNLDYRQNQLINLNMQCNYCKKIQSKGDIFYCRDCSLFFCSNCEQKIGINHPHCYYKIRNKDQFNEICLLHNANNSKKNINNDNSLNNNQDNYENPITGILSEGSKIIGEKINSVINFFSNNNQNDDNLNNPYINNNQNNNNMNNPNINISYIKNDSNNHQINNNVNNGNNNEIKNLVEKAKSQYNLEQMNDDEIERALIVCKGNIDKAVAILLSNHSI